MGGTTSQKYTVPINNSIIHLVLSNQNDLLIQKLESQKDKFDPNASFNFRGDTLMHYACSKNNPDLVQYLLKQDMDLSIQNNDGLKPVQLATNPWIISRIQTEMSNPSRISVNKNPEQRQYNQKQYKNGKNNKDIIDIHNNNDDQQQLQPIQQQAQVNNCVDNNHNNKYNNNKYNNNNTNCIKNNTNNISNNNQHQHQHQQHRQNKQQQQQMENKNIQTNQLFATQSKLKKYSYASRNIKYIQ